MTNKDTRSESDKFIDYFNEQIKKMEMNNSKLNRVAKKMGIENENLYRFVCPHCGEKGEWECKLRDSFEEATFKYKEEIAFCTYCHGHIFNPYWGKYYE